MTIIKVTMKYSTLKKTEDGSYYSSIRTENDQPMTIRINDVHLNDCTLSGDDDIWFTYSGEDANGIAIAEEDIVKDIKEDPSRWFAKNVREKTIDNSFISIFSQNGEFQVVRASNLKVFNKETKELLSNESVTGDDTCDIIVQLQGISFFKRNFQVTLKLHQVQVTPKTEEKKEEEEVCHDDWVMDDYGFDE